MSENGKLVKLIIESFEKNNYNGKPADTFTAMFNPNKYSLRYEINYNKKQAQGTAALAPKFSNMKPQELALEFTIDGTGAASKEVVDVDKKVKEFLKVAYEYKGKIHKNRYLRVSWSTLIFDCVLKSTDISYSLFKPDGKPIRAKINARFMGFVNDKLREKMMDASSPDLTHSRILMDNQDLPGLANEIYGSPNYYIDVAKMNNLVNFRRLTTGQRISFPPVKNNENS